jgi:hypothetical protein
MYIKALKAIILIVPLIFFSCEKNGVENDAPGFSSLDGFTDITSSSIFPEDFIAPCFYGVYTTNDYSEIVIRDEKSYRELQDSIRIQIIYHDCDSEKLPHIDFQKYTLLARKTQGGGCNVVYWRGIYKDPVNKVIKYQIRVIYSGSCAMLIHNRNWALIPKIPDDYTVIFETEEIKIDEENK